MPDKTDSGRDVKKLRLGVLISGGGRTMMNLLEQIKAGMLPAEIEVVIASRPCTGLDKALNAGLAGSLVPFKEYKDTGRIAQYSQEITRLLQQANVDLVVMAGFLSMWTIPPQFEGKVINIHPALLPEFGGKGMFGHHVHEAVIKAGRKTSGCTVHYVNNEYDSGPVILQRSVPVLEGDNADALAARVFEQECIALPDAIRKIAAGK